MTNSSSASFIVATNLNYEDVLGRIFNLDMTIVDKETIKKLLTDDEMMVNPYHMDSKVLQKLNTIIALDENADDYMEMRWLDEGTGNIRYKHVFVYYVEQFTPEWSVLFDLMKKFKSDGEIYVWHYYWGG